MKHALQNTSPDIPKKVTKLIDGGLTDLYNRTFNGFVRPKYDGAHQTFPDLDLKGLGMTDLYRSKRDAVWMDKMLDGNH